jgi:hypothetical protein
VLNIADASILPPDFKCLGPNFSPSMVYQKLSLFQDEE